MENLIAYHNFQLIQSYFVLRASLMTQVVKNLPAMQEIQGTLQMWV